MGYTYTAVVEAMKHVRDPDDFAQNSMLRQFVMRVAEAFPGCKFSQAHPGAQVEVFYPEDAFTMGRIAVGDFGKRKYTGIKYGVVSRKISNGRYEHLKQTTDLNKAVKFAQASLRRPTVQETLSVNATDAARAIYSDRKGASETTKGLLARMTTVLAISGTEPRIITEFRALRNAGYEFHTFKFTEEVDQLLEAYDESTRIPDKFDGRAVWMHEVGGNTVYDVCEVPKMHYTYQASTAGEPVRYTPETLPAEVAEKIAVLSMIEEGKSVPGVGYRSHSNRFYYEVA